MRALALVTAAILAGYLYVGAELAGASGYSYADGHGHYAGEQDVSTVPVVAEVARWGTYWLAAHGYRPCALSGGAIREAPDLRGDDYGSTPIDGRALGCDVWLRSGLVERAQSSMHTTVIWRLCMPELHELAHTAGMSHADMDSSGLEVRWQDQCVGLAHRIFVEHRRAVA